MLQKRTKIVCTLGPASDSFEELSRLFQAGMSVARLNFSHGSHEHHQKIINNLRAVEQKYQCRIPIIQDLQGPKIRIAPLAVKELKIKQGDNLKVEISPKATKDNLAINHPNLNKDCQIGDLLLINDGLIALKILAINAKSLLCEAQSNGLIKAGQGVNLSSGSFSLPAITAKDLQDLKFGLKNNLDFIALSFVKTAKDVEKLRSLIQKSRSSAKIISKIETLEAIKNLKTIIQASDGIMVARGDLGVNIPEEQVPVEQKRIIFICNKLAKPVITATQVLQSMINYPRATRAEISDAANAVYDHSDAIMLSNETAIGKYPFKAADTLSRVAHTVEKAISKQPELKAHNQVTRALSIHNKNCAKAATLAEKKKIKTIVAYTSDGYTAREIASNRPDAEIISICPTESIARQLNLSWGLSKIISAKIDDKNKVETLVKLVKEHKLVRHNQKILIICNASKKNVIIKEQRV